MGELLQRRMWDSWLHECRCPQPWAQPQAYPNVLAAAALAKIVTNPNILIGSSHEDL